MYTVTGRQGDKVVTIYNDTHLTEAHKGLNPRLQMKDNTAGTFDITLPVGNAGYDVLERLSSEITVYRDDIEIWSGRIIDETKNFLNHRILKCEGELAYLNDTTQATMESTSMTVREFLEHLINTHNSKWGLAEWQKFQLGAVMVHETGTFELQGGEKTLSVLKDKVVSEYGGHLIIRKMPGGRILDYVSDFPLATAQEIRFGDNLLDFTRHWDMTDFATVIVPTGADGLTPNGGPYVAYEPAVSKYGWIEKPVSFENVTDPIELRNRAEEYLAEVIFKDVVIEINAVDLRYLGRDARSIDIYNEVRCISKPHGMDRMFPVTQLNIQLDKPENSTYILGTPPENSSLSARTRSVNSSILKRIESLPNRSEITQIAQENANHVMNLRTRGVVTMDVNRFGSQFLAIADNTQFQAGSGIGTWDLWPSNTRLWLWNINGFAYSADGGRTFRNAAITMDGHIMANAITAGTMSADRISGGRLESIARTSWWNGSQWVSSPNVEWNLTTGQLIMRRGEIRLGTSSNNTPNFHVNEHGELTAQHGNIGGFEISAWDLSNDGLRLSTHGLEFRRGRGLDDNVGTFRAQFWAANNAWRGMAMDLDPRPDNNNRYITWGARRFMNETIYVVKLAYVAHAMTGFSQADRLNIGCDIDGHNWTSRNFWIDDMSGGAVNGVSQVVSVQAPNGGTWNLRFRNGFLVP
ncbi:MAG: phage tail protein [Oscillospiraceae bacterium]|nr:phage tail protein [Oscillospiraceae bacterium]